jgi:hypothetical protein
MSFRIAHKKVAFRDLKQKIKTEDNQIAQKCILEFISGGPSVINLLFLFLMEMHDFLNFGRMLHILKLIGSLYSLLLRGMTLSFKEIWDFKFI